MGGNAPCTLKPLHMRYARHIDRQRKWSGHLWQGRVLYTPLDEAYLWFCVRYVEHNPVRAGILARAQEYPWSSAAAHCGLLDDILTAKDSVHWKMFETVADWAEWPAEGVDEEHLGIVRRNIQKNLPRGSDRFIGELEPLAMRVSRLRSVGRPNNR
jgi:putative transposase